MGSIKVAPEKKRFIYLRYSGFLMNDFVPIQKTKILRVKVDLDIGRAFEDLCKNEKTNVNAKLKELIDDSLKGQKKHFLAGKNKVNYNKTCNSFEWLIELDSGREIKIFNNLSDNFLRNLKQEIDRAVQERNEWIHQTKSDSVDIPEEFVGDEN